MVFLRFKNIFLINKSLLKVNRKLSDKKEIMPDKDTFYLMHLEPKVQAI